LQARLPPNLGAAAGPRTRRAARKTGHTGIIDALVIIDFQNDFCPGGALAVPEGDRIAEPLGRLIDDFRLVVATRDWHPPDHGSFVGADIDPTRWRGADPPAIWPPHCVQGTPGAEFHASLDRSKIDRVVDKGQDRWSQGYSGFQDTELAEFLRSRDVDRLYVGGLATDYCVKNSVLDARRLGFDVTVIDDAIRGVEVNPGDSARAREEMQSAGAAFVTADEVEARRRSR
jgi:nicotinamidase/pyrazinamidase